MAKEVCGLQAMPELCDKSEFKEGDMEGVEDLMLLNEPY